MRVGLVFAALVLVLGVGMLIGFIFGVRTTGKREIQNILKKARLSVVDVQLYRRAAKILNRLVNVTELQGDLSADILSRTSRTQIEEWLAEYNKEIDKV